MDRSKCDKNLSKFDNAKLHLEITKLQNQKDFLYGTIRKKGSVKLLADYYDKHLKIPSIIPKPSEFPALSPYVCLHSADPPKKSFNNVKFETVHRIKEPIMTDYVADNVTFYSLESKPPDLRPDPHVDHFYEKIYGWNKDQMPPGGTEVDNSTPVQAQQISEVPVVKDTNISRIFPALHPKSFRTKVPDIFYPPRNVVTLFPSNSPTTKHKKSKTNEEDDEFISKEAMLIDKSKSDKNDSDEGEDLTYFHVLFYKNRDTFSSLQKNIKTTSVLTMDEGNINYSTQKCSSQQENIEIGGREPVEKVGKSSLEIYKKRKCAILNIINSEKKYVAVLEVISQYKSSFEKAHLATGYLCDTDNKFLFDDCLLFLERHLNVFKSFVLLEDELNSNNDVNVGDLILKLAMQEFEIGLRYLDSYPDIKKLLHRLMKNEHKYNELVKNVCLTNLADVKLEDLFFKPIFQLQMNISLWSDLLNVTAEDHPDYALLTEVTALSQTFLLQVNSSPILLEEGRLLKQAILVEKGNKSKKLVRLFLFKEVLVCTKEKISHGLKINRFVRWFIPLCHLNLETITKDRFSLQSTTEHENELNELQKELKRLQSEYEAELKNICHIDNKSLFIQSLMNRKVDSLQRKIEKQEVLLSLSLPILPLVVTNRSTRRSYCLLISSEYDQSQWVEAILEGVERAPNSLKLSMADVIGMVNANKLALSKNSTEPSESKASLMTGNLNLIIHKMVGLREKSRVLCAIETDFLGNFSLKERTNTVESREPEWNESFDVEMEGVKMLRILAYKREKVDILIGKCTLELDREWLSENSQFQNLMLNDELQLLASIKFSPQQNMMKKITKSQPGGMFGIGIKKITKKEGVLIPSIIRYCVMEVENRGTMELGIYRVSGLMTDVNKIKASFDRGDIDGSLALMERADVHVVTSLLKLFLRELPEALFTDSRYSDFMRVLDTKDQTLQKELFINLFKGLPSCNSASINYLLKHIIKVAELSEINKMSLENLATIFGSTLFRPPMASSSEPNEHLRIARETCCATRQAGVLLFYLRNVRSLSKWQHSEPRSLINDDGRHVN